MPLIWLKILENVYNCSVGQFCSPELSIANIDSFPACGVSFVSLRSVGFWGRKEWGNINEIREVKTLLKNPLSGTLSFNGVHYLAILSRSGKLWFPLPRSKESRPWIERHVSMSSLVRAGPPSERDFPSDI